MAPFKKDLTPLSKNGAVHKHKGKGSAVAPLPDRHTLQALQQAPTNSINSYAKATPMPSGQTDPTQGSASIGLGSGSWAGNGM